MSNTTNTNVTAITTINSNVITLAIATRTLKTACDKSSEMALKIGTVLLAVKANKLWKEKYNSLLEFYNDFGISTSDASRKMQIVRKLYDETIDEETGAKCYVLKMAALADYNYSQLAEIARYTDETMFIDLMNNINPEMSRNDIRAALNELIMEREKTNNANDEDDANDEKNEDSANDEDDANKLAEIADMIYAMNKKADTIINKKRPTKSERAWLKKFTEWSETMENLYAEK